VNRLKAFTYYDDPPTVPPPPPPPPTGVTFTAEQQAHVNKLLAENKRSIQAQNAELVKQLEELRSNANLTQQQKDELDARITTLQQQHLTKEQQLSSEVEKLNKKYKTDTETLTGESKKWRGSYEGLLIENSIMAGASKHSAASSKQLLHMLQSRAKVVEEVDDAGKPTGKFVVKLPMTVLDTKTKKPVEVELEMTEAIGKMREDADNANLFMFDGKTGLGGNNTAGGGSSGSGNIDWAKLTPEQHREMRKKVV
jgi:hypothetical protein